MVLTSTDSIPADRVYALADDFIQHALYPRNSSPRTADRRSLTTLRQPLTKPNSPRR